MRKQPFEVDEGKEEHRKQVIEHCIGTKQTLVNTTFDKPDTKLVTWRHARTKPEDPLARFRPGSKGTYETLDYWLIQHRWETAAPTANQTCTPTSAQTIFLIFL